MVHIEDGRIVPHPSVLPESTNIAVGAAS
jgi:hypothetical protein